MASPGFDEKGVGRLKIQGTFEVQMTPCPPDAGQELSELSRLLLDKSYSGPLKATGVGMMIGFRSATEGSAGYVAMERVTGVLNGRSGEFVLQHSSTMKRGIPHQLIVVVPDSATQALEGLSGEMTIEIENGQHSYHFEVAAPWA